MPHYRATVRSPWSPERAFEYLIDLEHFADWDPGVKRATRVSGTEPGIGAAFDVTVVSPGRDLIMRYETVEADAPRRFTVRAETSTLLSVDVITVDADAGGCVVTYDADLSLKGLLRLGDPLLGIAFRRIGDRAAAGLRQALEGVAAWPTSRRWPTPPWSCRSSRASRRSGTRLGGDSSTGRTSMATTSGGG
jgi:carbon monoxide dehydrogenase subunit G